MKHKNYSLKEEQIFVVIDGGIARRIIIKTKIDRYILSQYDFYVQVGKCSTDVVVIEYTVGKRAILLPNRMRLNIRYHIKSGTIKNVWLEPFKVFKYVVSANDVCYYA